MNIDDFKKAVSYINNTMQEQKDYLIKLDQENGDGDLGISMSEGYGAITKYLCSTEETDLGRALMKCSGIFNEAASSTLGTITSLGLMGMAKALFGKETIDITELAKALESGLEQIMDKAKSKPGDKTILDSLCPAVTALGENANKGALVAFEAAMEAAREGSESTRNMRSVHGRAAYYGDKSIGVIDAGSVAGKFIFESLYRYCAEKQG